MSRLAEIVSRLEALEHEVFYVKNLQRFAIMHLETDPHSSLNRTRTMLEKLVVDMYEREMGGPPKRPLLHPMLGESQFMRSVPKRYEARMRKVQMLGNIGTHSTEEAFTSDAVEALEEFLKVFEWYLKKYNLQVEVREVTAPEPKAKPKSQKAKVLKSPANRELNEVNAMYLRREFEEALQILDNQLKQNPKDLELRAQRAFCHLSVSRKEEAIEALEYILAHDRKNELALIGLSWVACDEKDLAKCRELIENKLGGSSSKHWAVHNLLGRVCMMEEAYNEAILYFTKGISLEPAAAALYHNRAIVKSKLNRTKGALSDYAKAIEKAPSFLSAISARAWLYHGIDNYEAAEKGFRKVLEMKPEDGNIYSALAEILRKQKNYSEALTNCVAAKKYGYTSLPLYQTWAECLRLQNEYKNAIVVYDVGLMKYPGDSFLMANKASCNYHLGNYKIAAEEFAAAAEAEGLNYFGWLQKGVSNYNIDNIEQCFEDVNESLKLNAEAYDAIKYRGFCHHYFDRHDEAITDLNKFIRQNDGDANAFYIRGQAHFGKDLYKEALLDFKTAERLGLTSYSWLYDSLGEIQYLLNQYQDSITSFDKAISLGSNVANSYYYRGLSYSGLNEFPKAIVDLKKAIELRDDYYLYYEALGALLRYKGDFKEAYGYYNTGLNMERGKTAKMYLGRGRSNQVLENYKDARVDLNEAVRLNPESGFCYRYLGLLDQTDGDYEQSIKNFLLAIKYTRQPDVLLYGKLAFGYYRTKDFENALKYIDLATAEDPEDSYAYFVAGLTHQKLKSIEKAYEQFSLSLRGDSEKDYQHLYFRAICGINVYKANPKYMLGKSSRSVEEITADLKIFQTMRRTFVESEDYEMAGQTLAQEKELRKLLEETKKSEHSVPLLQQCEEDLNEVIRQGEWVDECKEFLKSIQTLRNQVK